MTPSPLDETLAQIRQQISWALDRAGRRGQTVRLIGVTKGKSAENIAQALRLGLRDIGENYLQEWQGKQAQLNQILGAEAKDIVWHFIGHLQSNKVRGVVGQAEWIHTVDSLKLASKISQAAGAVGCSQKILLEVNLAAEPTKSGFPPSELSKALAPLAALPHLSIAGLMAIPPMAEDPEKSRPYFRQLKSTLDECNRSGVFTKPFTELSMGMSQDFMVAIEEGATMVRVGTALFGPRP